MSSEELYCYYDLSGKPIKNLNKNKIMEVTIELFSEKGYNAVSIRDITKKVGIKESSLYNHFQSKQELAETIYYNFQIETAKMMPPLKELDAILIAMAPEEFLKKGVMNFIHHINELKNERLWRLMLQERYRNDLASKKYLEEVVEKTIHFLITVFEKLLTLNKVTNMDAALLAVEYQSPIFTWIEQMILLRIDQKDSTVIEKQMLGHVQIFVKKML
jgi:AcrR family transcriptional regulator